jgi:N-acetylglucosaminyldiphosphoundecaprenol N-acetyl-beta-D-mannosaminyltransferase
MNKDITVINEIKINNVNFDEAISIIEDFIEAKNTHYVVTPNSDHIVIASKDEEFREICKNAHLVLADGMPVLWAAWFLGMPLKEKISGSDLFPRLCRVAAKKGYKLFFLGGRPGAAFKTSEMLKDKYPKIQIVGLYSPPFGFENDVAQNDKIVEMIKDSKPDILFVGLGAPKQEKWIYKHKEKYQVPVSIGIGASFELASGVLRRAPLWMQKAGLEWFWRFLMEPKRLWKRYFLEDMKFIWLVFRQKLYG